MKQASNANAPKASTDPIANINSATIIALIKESARKTVHAYAIKASLALIAAEVKFF